MNKEVCIQEKDVVVAFRLSKEDRMAWKMQQQEIA